MPCAYLKAMSSPIRAQTETQLMNDSLVKHMCLIRKDIVGLFALISDLFS